jgi:hypothetical protein
MATSYLSPGVYVEEVDRGSKPLEMVGTSTAGFIGETSVGPVNQPILCTNWSQFTKAFGDFQHSEYLAHAVYGFFNNGGGKCFVLNVGDPDGREEGRQGRPLHRHRQRPRHAHRPARARGDRRDQHRLRPRADGPGHPGRRAHALREDALPVRDPRLPRDIEKGGVDKLPKPRDSKYGAYYFPWIEVYDPHKGNIFQPPSGYMAGVYARVGRRARRAQGPGERDGPRRPRPEVQHHQGRAGHPEPQGHQLHPRRSRTVASASGAPARSRATPSGATSTSAASSTWSSSRSSRGTQWVVFEPNDAKLWKRDHPRHLGLPAAPLALGRALRQDPRGGLLRQVRLGDQPAGGHRRRPADLRDRHVPGEAGRIRHLPHRPDAEAGGDVRVVATSFANQWRGPTRLVPGRLKLETMLGRSLGHA